MHHLVGTRLPDVTLRTSHHSDFNPSHHKGRAVYFCYPYTGRPGVANPPNWDSIKGAHGSTPQALAFAAVHDKITAMSVTIFGLSLLSEEWISDFANRNALPYLLLSDHVEQFSKILQLPRFETGGVEYLERVTLITNASTITQVFYPINNPELNPQETLLALAAT